MFVTSLPNPPTVKIFLATQGSIPRIANVSVPNVNVPSGFTGPSTTLRVASEDVNVDPVAGQYSASSSSLTYASTAIPSPLYGGYVPTPTMPSASADNMPLNYPTTGFLGDLTAGLAPVPKPTIEIVERTQLTPVELLTYAVEPVELFSGDVPEFTGGDIDLLQPLEFKPINSADSFVQALKDKAAVLEPVLTEHIQRLMYEDQTKYIERKELFGTQKIMNDAAARGFSMPTGIVNGAVAELLNEIRVEKREVAEKVRDEVYERTRDVVTEALASLISLERRYVSHLLNYAAKTIEVQRYNVQMAVETFNAMVGAFNEEAKIVNLLANAYREYVRALTEQDSAVVAQIAVEKARIDSYKADVKMFRSQIDLFRAASQVNELDLEQRVLVLKEFEARMEGYRQNVDLAKLTLEGYRTAVGSLSQKIEADLAAIQGYTEAVDSEASKLAVFESNVDAYASFWQAQASQQSSYASYVSDALSVFQQELDNYRQYGDAQRSYFAALAAEAQAKQGAARAYLQAVEAGVRHNETYNRGQVEVTYAINMAELAKADLNTKIEALNAQANAEQIRIDMSLKAAEATAQAGLAQAAYSTMSVTARLSDDGGFTYASNIDQSRSISLSGTRSWSKTTTHEEAAI